jgi:hypothetical protein
VSTWWSQYYDAPIDHSTSFDERVAKLADTLSAELGVPVDQDTDMNYNAGQRVSVLVTGDGKPTLDPDSANYRVSVLVSSKAPLWARMVWRKTGPREWRPAPVSEIADNADTVLRRIAETMDAAGLRQVPDDVLEDGVDGRVTEMDELPATVRDVLFCEVC